MRAGRDRESPRRSHARNSNPAKSEGPPKPSEALPKRTSSRRVHKRARADLSESHRAAHPRLNSLHGDGHVRRGENGERTPTPCVPLGA